MPDLAVLHRRRAAAFAVVAVLGALAGACSSSGTGDKSWQAENAYGSEMARRGYWREALFRYERAAALKPNDAQIQNNLAVAYESIGDTSRALSAYKRALELAPQDAKIKRNYARFAEYYTSVQRASSLPGPSASSPAAPVATPPAAPPPSAAPAAPAPPTPTPAAAPTPAAVPTPAGGPA